MYTKIYDKLKSQEKDEGKWEYFFCSETLVWRNLVILYF